MRSLLKMLVIMMFLPILGIIALFELAIEIK
jgi:hypothetical protein